MNPEGTGEGGYGTLSTLVPISNPEYFINSFFENLKTSYIFIAIRNSQVPLGDPLPRVAPSNTMDFGR